MKSLVCDLCGGKLTMGAGGIATCESCGMEHGADRMKEKVLEIRGTVAVDNSHLIENYLEMALNAYDSGNQLEAETYCNRIIEMEPTNYMAWLTKGKAAGWQSTLKNHRFSESVSAFTRAIDNAPEDEKEELVEEVKLELTNLALALISLRAERFEKWPDKEEANGFLTDITSIINTMKQFVLQASIPLPLPEIMGSVATQINQAVVNAWKTKILPDYEGDENRPDEYDWKRFIERIDYCIDLLETANKLCDTDDESDIQRYKNIIYFNEKAIDSCSWDYKYVYSQKTWFKAWSLTDEAKETRRRQNILYKKIIICRECKGKSAGELYESALSYLKEGENLEAEERFHILTKMLPEEQIGYIGEAIALANDPKTNDYSDVYKKVLVAKDKKTSSEYKAKVGELVNYLCCGFALLMHACTHKRLDVVEALISMGADINKKSINNTTPLWHVCSQVLPENQVLNGRRIARILLDMGAEVDITNTGGVALYNKNTDLEIAKMLLSKYPNLKKGNAANSYNGGCYVATCVYGSYDCPEVWTLRRYRDDKLASTWYGRLFVRTYYTISPTIVRWFGKTEWFKKMWRHKLDKMVERLQEDGVESTPYNDKKW